MLNQNQEWIQRWQKKETPWDLGQAHPEVEALVLRAQEVAGFAEEGLFWVPGCGRGHEAYLLSQIGYEVRAVDIAEEAVKEARLQGGNSRLSYSVADVLCPRAASEEALSYAAIFDRAMLCAFEPEQRPFYVASCHERLKEGGLFMGILFSQVNSHKHPPYAINLDQVLELWSPKFTLVDCVEKPAPYESSVIQREMLLILRKA